MPSFTREELIQAARSASSMTEVIRNLGLCPTGGNHVHIKKYIAQWEVSTSHFLTRAERVRAIAKSPTPLNSILVRHSTYSRSALKKRLYAMGLKTPQCELCGQGEYWHGRKMSLILDHINGSADDNRLKNLRIICPNCDATLDTYCGKNKDRTGKPFPICACGKRVKSSKEIYCSRACYHQAQSGKARPHTRKVARPSKAKLLRQLKNSNFTALGRLYGVSDNAIRKWLK
jgi:hypothetical protein